MLASKYQLDNLVFIVDFNRYQQTGSLSEISNPIEWTSFANSLGLFFSVNS